MSGFATLFGGLYPTEPTDKEIQECIDELMKVDYRANFHTTGAFQPLIHSNPPLPLSYFEGKLRERILYSISKPLVNLMFNG